MEYGSKQEKSVAINGLACLVQALRNIRIRIDLQNESSVSGIAKEIDGYMNILLEEVIYEDCEENSYNYETLYVKGRNIRYIHIPKHLLVRETILKYLSKVQGKAGPRKTTAVERFKQSKLMQRQRETVLLVEKIKKERQEAATSKDE
ncbi:U7 snRNA-associated Sm-like protein LSm10 [Planococcus citri]|uniref:U7 snRNA-associated Sm-like protein LSm10 n=1 Tax=Planococcus citri TaxID=170843 RepID=UPI0031F748DC